MFLSVDDIFEKNQVENQNESFLLSILEFDSQKKNYKAEIVNKYELNILNGEKILVMNYEFLKKFKIENFEEFSEEFNLGFKNNLFVHDIKTEEGGETFSIKNYWPISKKHFFLNFMHKNKTKIYNFTEKEKKKLENKEIEKKDNFFKNDYFDKKEEKVQKFKKELELTKTFDPKIFTEALNLFRNTILKKNLDEQNTENLQKIVLKHMGNVETKIETKVKEAKIKLEKMKMIEEDLKQDIKTTVNNQKMINQKYSTILENSSKLSKKSNDCRSILFLKS